MRCGINYVMDGPCGDCPKLFTCNAEDCFDWLVWDKVGDIITTAIEKVGE